jgi:hypothetical protein
MESAWAEHDFTECRIQVKKGRTTTDSAAVHLSGKSRQSSHEPALAIDAGADGGSKTGQKELRRVQGASVALGVGIKCWFHAECQWKASENFKTDLTIAPGLRRGVVMVLGSASPSMGTSGSVTEEKPVVIQNLV